MEASPAAGGGVGYIGGAEYILSHMFLVAHIWSFFRIEEAKEAARHAKEEFEQASLRAKDSLQQAKDIEKAFFEWACTYLGVRGSEYLYT